MKAYFAPWKGNQTPILLDVERFQDRGIDWDDVYRQAKQKFGEGTLYTPYFNAEIDAEETLAEETPNLRRNDRVTPVPELGTK